MLLGMLAVAVVINSFVGLAEVTTIVATLGWWVDTSYENVFMLANDTGFGSDPNDARSGTVGNVEATETSTWNNIILIQSHVLNYPIPLCVHYLIITM